MSRCSMGWFLWIISVNKNYESSCLYNDFLSHERVAVISAKNHKRQRRKRQTRKVANAKGLNRNTNLT